MVSLEVPVYDNANSPTRQVSWVGGTSFRIRERADDFTSILGVACSPIFHFGSFFPSLSPMWISPQIIYFTIFRLLLHLDVVLLVHGNEKYMCTVASQSQLSGLY